MKQISRLTVDMETTYEASEYSLFKNTSTSETKKKREIQFPPSPATPCHCVRSLPFPLLRSEFATVKSSKPPFCIEFLCYRVMWNYGKSPKTYARYWRYSETSASERCCELATADAL